MKIKISKIKTCIDCMKNTTEKHPDGSPVEFHATANRCKKCLSAYNKTIRKLSAYEKTDRVKNDFRELV